MRRETFGRWRDDETSPWESGSWRYRIIGKSCAPVDPYDSVHEGKILKTGMERPEIMALATANPCSLLCCPPSSMQKLFYRREQCFIDRETDDHDDEHDANHLIHRVEFPSIVQ